MIVSRKGRIQMMHNNSESRNNQTAEKNSTLVTVCGTAVRLIFANKMNDEVPEIVGKILKGAYLQRQSV